MKLKLTPLIQVVLFLVIYAFLALIFNLDRSGELNTAVLYHTVSTLGICFLVYTIGKLLGQKKMISNTIITGLILFLIINPATTILSFIGVCAASATAMALKVWGEYKGAPLVNPAVFGILLVTTVLQVFGGEGLFVSWWGASYQGFISLVLILAWLLWGTRKWRKTMIVFPFVLTHLILMFITGQTIEFIQFTFADATIYFLASIMLIEPKTSPVKTGEQAFFAIITALFLNILLNLKINNFELWAIALANLGYFGWRFRKMLLNGKLFSKQLDTKNS